MNYKLNMKLYEWNINDNNGNNNNTFVNIVNE